MLKGLVHKAEGAGRVALHNEVQEEKDVLLTGYIAIWISLIENQRMMQRESNS